MTIIISITMIVSMIMVLISIIMIIMIVVGHRWLVRAIKTTQETVCQGTVVAVIMVVKHRHRTVSITSGNAFFVDAKAVCSR